MFINNWLRPLRVIIVNTLCLLAALTTVLLQQLDLEGPLPIVPIIVSCTWGNFDASILISWEVVFNATIAGIIPGANPIVLQVIIADAWQVWLLDRTVGQQSLGQLKVHF